MRPTQSTQSKPTTQISNTIAKNKKQSESEFRVHFTLMNIKWKIKQPQKEQKLIDYVINVVNEYCRVHIAQIIADVDGSTYDVSVGLCGDGDAWEFLRTGAVGVKLNDGVTTHQYQYKPFISRVFQSYINKMNKNAQALQPQPQHQPQLLTQSQPLPMDPIPQISRTDSITSLPLNRFQSKQSINYSNMESEVKESSAVRLEEMGEDGVKSGEHLGKKEGREGREGREKEKERHRDREKERQKQRQRQRQKERENGVNRIWAFGIPKQYTIPQIKLSLKKHNLQPLQCRWKNRQHMQYLQIQLSAPIPKSKVYYLSLQIDEFPYIAIPQVPETEITRELARYTVEIITRPTCEDQEKFIKCMSQIGGINVMIRTPVKEKEDYRYLVVFNNVDHAEKACRAAKEVRECTAQRKQYQLRIGRLNKFYCFTSLIKQMRQHNHHHHHRY